MRIGIIRYWIGRAAAEHEVVERIKVACEISGHEAIELRSDGLTLDGSYPLVDFVINLHFASAKSTSHLSYGALWNPWSYYFMWDFKRSFANQISNDFLISCGSDKIDQKFTSAGLPIIVEPKLNHTVAEIYAEPDLRNDRKLFYIGINWEKNSRTHGRHHKLLKELDRRGIIDIYGPKKVGDVKPWEGFKGYKGELPFDGKSVLETASKLGVALVLSSKEHEENQIMSNRLFEGVASGAAIIGDNHSFLQKNFGSTVWQIDSSRSFEYQAEEISQTLDAINANPTDTRERILKSQEILKSNFNLAKQIQNIANHAKESLAVQKPKIIKNATAVVFIDNDYQIVENFFQNLDVAGFKKVIIMTNRILDLYPENADIYLLSNSPTTQDYFRKYLEISDTGEYVSFFNGHETIFPNYLDSLTDIEDSQLGVFVSGALIEENNSAYAVIFNPLTMDWRDQLLAGVILNRSRYLEYSTTFGKYNFHKVLFYKYEYFLENKLVTISPKTRFRLQATSDRMNNYYPEGITPLIQELRANPYFSTDVQWCANLATELRSVSNDNGAFTNNDQFLHFIYSRLKLPKYIKRYLKIFVLYILRY
jgi:hypothetical protein